MVFLRLSDGILTGKSALISLSSPSPLPSVEPKPKLDCHDFRVHLRPTVTNFCRRRSE